MTGSSRAARLLLGALAILTAAVAASPSRDAQPVPGGVAVYRTMMPECGPSSFAVAFGRDLGFSFDPGRGGDRKQVTVRNLRDRCGALKKRCRFREVLANRV